MFKLTCFTSVSPKEMGPALKGLHIVDNGTAFVWKLDGHEFRIEPFKHQETSHQAAYGYRVYFSGSIDGGMYLFDMSMGCFQPTIHGIEYELTHPTMQQNDWIRECNRRASFKKGSLPGIYERKSGLGVICLPNGSTIFQFRKKIKSFKLMEFLKEIELVKSELMPVERDLFTEGGIAI